MQRLTIPLLSLVAFAAPASAQPAPDPAAPPPAEPAPPSAPPPAAAVTTAPPPAPQPETKPDTPAITGKWTTTFYGFAEGDLIMDQIQGPAEGLGNGALPRPANGMTPAAYAAEHSQFTTSSRNSRIGFRFTAPAVNDIKVGG